MILDSYTKSSMKLSWFKIGVYLTNLEVSSFAVRLDEVEKYDIAKSEGKRLKISTVLNLSSLGL